MRKVNQNIINAENFILQQLEEEFIVFNKPFVNKNLKEKFLLKITEQKKHIKVLEDHLVGKFVELKEDENI